MDPAHLDFVIVAIALSPAATAVACVILAIVLKRRWRL